MAGGEAVIAGLGFRAGCPAEDIVAVVRLAEARSGHAVTGLAVPDWKGRAPGLLAAAATLGLTIASVDRATLAAMQPRCPTRSAAAGRATGLASVAEAAALAAGGTLVLPRVTAGQATCALAAFLPLPSGEGRGEGLASGAMVGACGQPLTQPSPGGRGLPTTPPATP